MKKANCFNIKNTTDRDILFWPKEHEFRQQNGWKCRAQHFIFVDHYMYMNFELDLDEWVFQFLDDNIEISVDDIDKHGITLEYMIVKTKKG